MQLISEEQPVIDNDGETTSDEDAYYSCNEGEAMIEYAEVVELPQEPVSEEKQNKKKRRRRRRKPQSKAYYSCNEEEAMIEYAEVVELPQESNSDEKQNKKKRHKRGPRKPKNRTKEEVIDDDDVLLCPLANEESDKGDALS